MTTTTDTTAQVEPLPAHLDAAELLATAVAALDKYRAAAGVGRRNGLADLALMEWLDEQADEGALRHPATETMARFIANGTMVSIDDANGYWMDGFRDDASDRTGDLALWSEERTRENAATDAYWKAWNGWTAGGWGSPEMVRARGMSLEQWLAEWPSLRCPAHGGRWGHDDDACKRCTDEQGFARPIPDLGPDGTIPA